MASSTRTIGAAAMLRACLHGFADSAQEDAYRAFHAAHAARSDALSLAVLAGSHLVLLLLLLGRTLSQGQGQGQAGCQKPALKVGRATHCIVHMKQCTWASL